MSTTVEHLLLRVHAVVGLPIEYRLGGGGMDPTSPTPADRQGTVDCSGFVAWALGLSRMTEEPLYQRFNGGWIEGIGLRGWINTCALAYDLTQDAGILHTCEAQPGAIIVYPGPPRRRVGHCGIIMEVQRGTITQVAHASRTNWETRGAAIQITGPELFYREDDTRLGFFAGIVRPDETAPPALDIPLIPRRRPWYRRWWGRFFPPSP